jgi:RNA polymerase sigma factor (sigma-70 family)
MNADRADPDEVLKQAAWTQRVAKAMVRDAQLAEDLAQEALEAGLNRDVPPLRGIRSWLYGVLRNLTRQAARREAHLRERELRSASPQPQTTPDELLEKIELQRAVSDAVIQLPEALRSALILRFYEQRSVREVARVLDISEAAAASRIRRGLQQLRRSFASRYGTTWAVVIAPIAPSSTLIRTAALIMSTKTKYILATACALILTVVYVALEGVGTEAGRLPEARSVDSHAAASTPSEIATAHGTAASFSPLTDQSPGIARETAVGDVRLYVVDHAEDPIQGARFALYSADAYEVIASGVTDVEGSAALPGFEGSALVVVAAAAKAPWWGPLPIGPRPEIKLPVGKIVSGLALVDGKPAVRALPLELRSEMRLLPREPLPSRVLELVGIDSQATGTLTGSTDSAGRFSFYGLPSEWEGSIRCTDALYMTPGQNTQVLYPVPWTPIPPPHSNFVLVLVESPAVRGQVVLHDESTPAFPGWVTATLRYPHNQKALNVSKLQPDGSFEIVMRPWVRAEEQPLYLELAVSTTACSTQWTFEPIPPDLAVGKCVLPPTRRLTLQVSLPEGGALVGASAGVAGMLAGPTDDEGRLTLEVSTERCEVDIRADGFIPERVQLEAGEESIERRIALIRTRDLKILVCTPGRDPVIDAEVLLRFDQDALELPPWRAEAMSSIAVGVLDRWSEGDGRHELLVRTDSSGRVALRYLRVGRLVSVRVTPAGSSEMQETVLGPVPALGDLEHVFTVATGRRTFSGMIIDSQGRGVRPKSLKLVAEVGIETVQLASPKVDEEGRFSAALLDDGAFFVVIEAPGHASLRREVLEFDEDAGPTTFRLAKGRTLEVHVLDDAGNPLAGAVTVHPEDREMLWARLEGGRCSISDLPHEELTISAVVGGRSYEREVTAYDTAIDFVLPVHGGLRLGVNDAMLRRGKDCPFMIYLAPLEGGSQIVFAFRLPELLFPTVKCGTYWARLAETTGFGTEETLGDWKQVTIRPGELTELTF